MHHKLELRGAQPLIARRSQPSPSNESNGSKQQLLQASASLRVMKAVVQFIALVY
jgi:hypothetical protein